MPVKRKRSALKPDEDSVPNLQLRSGLVTSSSAPSCSTRSSAKQAASLSKSNSHGASANDDADEDTADELTLKPQVQPQGTPRRVTRTYARKDQRLHKSQKLNDETNLPRADPVDNSESNELHKARRSRRGRPETQGFYETSSDLVADLPLAAQSPLKKPRRTVIVEITTTPKMSKPLCPPPEPIHASPSPTNPLLVQSIPLVETTQQGVSDAVYNPYLPDAGILPTYLHDHLNGQKRQTLRTLQCSSKKPRSHDEDSSSVNDAAAMQLQELVNGTVLRAEGNSCILLGPRGSGKSQILERCLDGLPVKPILLRLSGWIQTTDRHALREIAFQLLRQTGSSILPDSESVPEPEYQDAAGEEENPFLDPVDAATKIVEDPNLRLPPSSHLHALIPIFLTLNRPVIVILDAFDLFALHSRQSLLYCLLDTVQNCRASSESRGLAVIGLTSRLDTVQLLEKRVKSRFSGRTIRTAPPNSFQEWMHIMRWALQPFSSGIDKGRDEEWSRWWLTRVEEFLADPEILNLFHETFSISRDPKLMEHLLRTPILRLSPNDPNLTFKSLSTSAEAQRSRPCNLLLTNLSYPTMCLLIASVHADTSGHPTFTFEMLFDYFRDQLRASTAAPVQVNGGNIGMVRCTREVLMTTFDGLIVSKIFVCVTGASSNTGKEFVKYRSNLDRTIVKPIVEKSGQIHLKKWLTKAQ